MLNHDLKVRVQTPRDAEHEPPPHTPPRKKRRRKQTDEEHRRRQEKPRNGWRKNDDGIRRVARSTTSHPSARDHALQFRNNVLPHRSLFASAAFSTIASIFVCATGRGESPPSPPPSFSSLPRFTLPFGSANS